MKGLSAHLGGEVNSESKSYQLFKVNENIDLTRVDCKVELIESRMLLRKNNYRHKMFLNNIHRNSKIMDEIIEYFMSQGYLNNLISIRSDNGDMIEKNKDYLSKKISCLIKDNGRK